MACRGEGANKGGYGVTGSICYCLGPFIQTHDLCVRFEKGGRRELAVSDSVCGTGGRKRSLDPIYLCVYTNVCVPGLLFHMLHSSPFDAHYLNKKSITTWYHPLCWLLAALLPLFISSSSYINKGRICSFLFIKVPNQKWDYPENFNIISYWMFAGLPPQLSVLHLTVLITLYIIQTPYSYQHTVYLCGGVLINTSANVLAVWHCVWHWI